MTDMPSPCDFELQLARAEKERDQAVADAKEWMCHAAHWQKQYNDTLGSLEELTRTVNRLSTEAAGLRRRNNDLVDALIQAIKRRYDDES